MTDHERPDGTFLYLRKIYISFLIICFVPIQCEIKQGIEWMRKGKKSSFETK